MAKIDTGGFGRQVAPAVERGPVARVVPGAYDRSSGITRFGADVQHAGDVVAQQAAIDRERNRIEAENVAREQESARRVAEVTRAQRDQIAFGLSADEKVGSILGDDAIPQDQKPQHFQDWISSERQGLEATYKIPEVLGHMQGQIDGMQAKGITDLKAGMLKQNQAQTRANVASSVEMVSRQALNAADPEADIARANKLVTDAAMGSGWEADDVQRFTQQNAETISAAHASKLVLDDPAAALEKLRSDFYPQLSPEARTALESRAMAELEQRAARARIDAEVRASKAARFGARLQNKYRDGVQPTPQEVATFADLSRGTEMEGAAAEMQSLAANRASFAGKPLAAQANELQKLTVRAHDPAIGVTDEEQFQLHWKEQQHTALQQRINTHGALSVYAETHGIQLPEIDTTSAEGIAQGLAARHDLALEASIWSGRTESPLRPEEIKAFGHTLQEGNATRRLRLLDGLRRAVTDPAEYRATMGELSKGNANLAYAGNMMQDGDNNAAELIVTGDAILNPPKNSGGKAPPFPTDENLRTVFEEETSGMFEGNAADRDRLFQASRAVLAANNEKAGVYGDVIDPPTWRKAIQTAAGGIEDLDQFLNWGAGRRVVRPVGMSSAAFRNAVRGATPEQVRSLGGVAGYSDEEAAEAIRDGALKNFNRDGVSGYTVRDGAHALMKPDLSGPFVWSPTGK